MEATSFRKLCADKGLAVTHQRQVIWETLIQMQGHPSPEEVYGLVRDRIPSISLATVYKNVRTFIEQGLLAELSLHHGSARLETNVTPHHHMVCLRCRGIVDLADEELEPVRLRKRAPDGFQIHRFSVEVIGICMRCAQ